MCSGLKPCHLDPETLLAQLMPLPCCAQRRYSSCATTSNPPTHATLHHHFSYCCPDCRRARLWRYLGCRRLDRQGSLRDFSRSVHRLSCHGTWTSWTDDVTKRSSVLIPVDH